MSCLSFNYIGSDVTFPYCMYLYYVLYRIFQIFGHYSMYAVNFEYYGMLRNPCSYFDRLEKIEIATGYSAIM